jgi:hypothetical protein
MGTAQLLFAVDRAVDRNIAHDRMWRERKWRQSRALFGSMLCVCATGSYALSAPVGSFRTEVTLSRSGPVRKWSWSEVCSAHDRLFPPRFFSFLSSSTVVQLATWCDRRSFDPFGVPLGVRMRNGKLRNTHSDRRSREPFGSVLGVFSISIGNPAPYI